MRCVTAPAAHALPAASLQQESMPMRTVRRPQLVALSNPALLVALLVTALVPSPVLAQDPAVDAAVERLAAEIIEPPHHIHQYPELGNREFETAALVAEHLRALGFDEVREGIAHTGVVGILRGGLPGDTVAVRADMDAL